MSIRRALILLPALLSMSLVALPATADPEVSFSDTADTMHEEAVAQLAALDIVRGCADDRFCAWDELTRGQVATMLDAALDLPAASEQGRFSDTAGSVHAESIDAVAEAGLTSGCADGRFCPSDSIPRSQLATMLQNAFDIPEAPSGVTYFDDATGHHGPAIDALTEAGISAGCGLVTFCSSDALQRGQAAHFVARSLDLVDRVDVRPYDERKAEHEEQLAEERAAAEAEAAAAAEEAANQPAARAVEVAKAQLGKPYAWGGTGPNSFDCSGLTQFAWRAAGVELPRTSSQQYNATTRISRSQLRPGDLVFYHSPVSHVAMYIVDGRVVEAPNRNNNVRIREDGLTRSGVVGYGRP